MRGSERIERSISGATLAEFLQQGAGLVADDMAARFAVTASDVQGDSLLISILGIENYSDYASVLSWIESLELVENATVERIEGEKMVLRIEGQADAVQLSTLLGLNRRLEPVPVDGFNPQDSPQLSYRWRKSG